MADSHEAIPEVGTATTVGDFYMILQVPRDATLEQIKQQYRKLTLLYHPDKEGGDQTRFAQINMAYKVLSSRTKRVKYDQSLSGTYDDLVAVERDRTYHRNEEFLTRDETGREVFDKKRFTEAFEASNTTLAQTFQDQERVSRKVDDDALSRMMAERDRLVVDFQQQMPREDLLADSKRFNQVFDDLRRQRQELVEVGDGISSFGDGLQWGQYDTVHTGLANASWQPEASGLIGIGQGGLNLASPGFQRDVVRDLLKTATTSGGAGMETEDWKARQQLEEAEALMERYHAESQRLSQLRREDLVRVDDKAAAEAALTGGHSGFIETVDKQRLDYNDIANPDDDDETYFASQSRESRK